LFWSFIMISLILFVFSLLFVQQMTVVILEGEGSMILQQERQRYFGSVERTALTLLETTMGGLDWDLVYELVAPLGAFYTAVFIFYILFYNFAVMNILTGIFLESALKLCKPDDEERIAEQRLADARVLGEIKRLGLLVDTDRSGTIKKDEFVFAARNPEFVSCFAAIGIDVADGDTFFKKVARSDYECEIDLDDFASRIMQAKVMASSLDLQSLGFQLQHGLQQLQGCHRKQSVATHRLDGHVTGLARIIHDTHVSI